MHTPFELFGLTLSLVILTTFSPLVLALAAVHYWSRKTLFALLSLSVITGLSSGIISLIALPSIIILCAAGYVFKHATAHWTKVLSGAGIFILGCLLLLHIPPGFNNPVLMNGVQISEHAPAFTKYLNFDKALLGLILLIFVVPKAQACKLAVGLKVAAVFILLSTASISFAVHMELISFEPKLPNVLIGWMVTNLFFTCLVEEAFFRGFIQQQLQNVSTKPYWQACCVLLSGLLFGLAHFPAGVVYTIIASVMGIAYAYSYVKTQNIFIAIGAHFAFNLVHFCYFTYPFIS